MSCRHDIHERAPVYQGLLSVSFSILLRLHVSIFLACFPLALPSLTRGRFDSSLCLCRCLCLVCVVLSTPNDPVEIYLHIEQSPRRCSMLHPHDVSMSIQCRRTSMSVKSSRSVPSKEFVLSRTKSVGSAPRTCRMKSLLEFAFFPKSQITCTFNAHQGKRAELSGQ